MYVIWYCCCLEIITYSYIFHVPETTKTWTRAFFILTKHFLRFMCGFGKLLFPDDRRGLWSNTSILADHLFSLCREPHLPLSRFSRNFKWWRQICQKFIRFSKQLFTSESILVSPFVEICCENAKTVRIQALFVEQAFWPLSLNSI